MNNPDEVAFVKLKRLQRKINKRRVWLAGPTSYASSTATILPSITNWNPQHTFMGGIYIDDLDMVVINAMRSSFRGVAMTSSIRTPLSVERNINVENAIPPHLKAEAEEPSILAQSIARTAINVENLLLFGWLLEFDSVKNILSPDTSIPCTYVLETDFTTMRNSARIIRNNLAQNVIHMHGKSSKFPQYIAVYSPKMKRLSAYATPAKWSRSQHLANEAHLKNAAQKISSISLVDAISTALTPL